MMETTTLFKEHEHVVLTHDIPEAMLTRGDIGTLVGIYDDQEGFEVEFFTAKGRTLDVLTLERADIRPITDNEILHSRSLEAA